MGQTEMRILAPHPVIPARPLGSPLEGRLTKGEPIRHGGAMLRMDGREPRQASAGVVVPTFARRDAMPLRIYLICGPLPGSPPSYPRHTSRARG